MSFFLGLCTGVPFFGFTYLYPSALGYASVPSLGYAPVLFRRFFMYTRTFVCPFFLLTNMVRYSYTLGLRNQLNPSSFFPHPLSALAQCCTLCVIPFHALVIRILSSCQARNSYTTPLSFLLASLPALSLYNLYNLLISRFRLLSWLWG